ncbi:MAG: hypothetical protein LPK45_10590 [Bacteroidota bacterium]|nr:hypothetical protein [Bacteroidota bacterium]MDX5431546.1 hypothetical protein [Bacteroidota bacterium]MDX5470267.1 hypothetical protein [Bacteroidota bacterium]
MNRIKEEPKTEQEQTQEAPKKRGVLVELGDLNWSREEVRKVFPFIFFLAGLAIIHIYNSNQAIKVVRQCDELNKEIKEARAEYISVKSELMYRSKQSQVSKRLEGTGLKELKQPPYKITETEEDRDER